MELYFKFKFFQTGWGKTSTFSETSDELMKVVLDVMSSDDCYEILDEDIIADEIYPTQICAGGIRGKVSD